MNVLSRDVLPGDLIVYLALNRVYLVVSVRKVRPNFERPSVELYLLGNDLDQRINPDNLVKEVFRT